MPYSSYFHSRNLPRATGFQFILTHGLMNSFVLDGRSGRAVSDLVRDLLIATYK
jgi:hypothetical protein